MFDNVRPFYFVTFNTYERQRFLARPEVHEAFSMFCSKAQEMALTAKDIIIPALVKVHDTLTPAQRQKLAEMVKSHHPQGGFGGPQQ